MRIVDNYFDKFYGMLFWETEFDGFKGAIKENYSDFIVREILPDGTILDFDNPDYPHSGFEGLFTHFILVKEGIGNYEVVWILSDILRIPTSWFSYYGNKDRDALTIQKMAVWSIPPEKLTNLKLPSNIKILNPKRELRRLHIGQHRGNYFQITIRNLEPASRYRELQEFFEWSSKQGIKLPNFFGYQRFGVTKPVSSIIGKLLVKKRYREAIMVFLTFPSVYDDELLKSVKRSIEEENFEEALKLLPRRGFIFEKNVLRNLIKYKEDYKKIIKKLPKMLIRMFIEAYQSYIFNLTLSRYRMRELPYEDDGKTVRLPMIGFDTRIKDKEIKEIVNDILEIENLSFNDFKNKDIPSLNIGGSEREASLITKISTYKIYKSNKRALLEFALKKGQFATIIMREIFKENILFALYSKLASRFGKTEFEKRMVNIISKGQKILDEVSDS